MKLNSTNAKSQKGAFQEKKRGTPATPLSDHKEVTWAGEGEKKAPNIDFVVFEQTFNGLGGRRRELKSDLQTEVLHNSQLRETRMVVLVFFSKKKKEKKVESRGKRE